MKDSFNWETFNPYLVCIRCNHEWWARCPNLPKVCPKCKSPYWNKKRIRKIKEG